MKPRYPNFCKKKRDWNMHAIKDCNQRAGQFFFSPDTMRFFNSRVLDRVYQGNKGVYFVTSEKFRNEPRCYTVRRFFEKSGKVDTVGEHQEFSSAARAATQAKKLAGRKREWRRQ